MDCEKLETEQEVFGFFVADLQKEFETKLRKHCKKYVDHLTDKMIDSAQKDLSVETARKLRSAAENSMQLTKPYLIKMFLRTNALFEKYFRIPDHISIDDSIDKNQNSCEMDRYEQECKEKIAELELVHKQQAVMLKQLNAEMEFYDQKLMEDAIIDNNLCDLFEENLANINDDVTDTARILLSLNDVEAEVAAVVNGESSP